MNRLGTRLRWRRLPGPLEIVLILLGYFLYSLVRLAAPHRMATSFQHAQSVLSVEKALGVFDELRLNWFLSHHHLLTEFASYWYATAHFIVTPLVLVWLYRRRAWAYPALRSALVIATLFALVVYAAWPLAPPRFAVAGAIDTVIDSPVAWARHGAASFVNEFAAMPSLHVGWAVWCAAAVVYVTRSRWRHLVWLYPLTTTWVVVATANHYLLDAVAGTVVALIPLWMCGVRLHGPALVAEEEDLALAA